MTEYIGSRISLISKSDIRYVGTLHEINSENSTVALEQVKSFGTEGRRQSPDEEIPGSDSVYEYIVFRGSDVKDLKIEEGPKENKAPPPQVPNDPAILGSGSRPLSQSDQPPPPRQASQGPRQNQPSHFQPPAFPPYQQYNQFHNQRFNGPQGLQPGFGGPPNGFQGYPGMPYGGPPGWYPPPGQGFPQAPPPFSPQHQQSLPYGGARPPSGPNQPMERKSPPASYVDSQHKAPVPAKDNQTPNIPQAGGRRNENSGQKSSQPEAKPVLDKPKSEVQVDTSLSTPTLDSGASTAAKNAVNAAKNSKIVPVVPLTSLAKNNAKAGATAPQAVQQAMATAPGTTDSSQPSADATAQYQNATQAATAAVAAAMSKLAPAPGQKPKANGENIGIDNLTKKVNEMRTDDRNRHAGRPGASGHANEHRGGRGGRRGGHYNKGLEVPATDFDFESANAKFDKQNLVKETGTTGGLASADVPLALDGENGDSNTAGADVIIPPVAESYNKSSFFDNISSEAKDRELAVEGKRRVGGPEFRNEERKKNVETFGMGSVEGGYRGGHRGRGGRGRGYRGGFGRGGGNRGGNGYRGARGGGLNTASTAAARAATAGG